MSEVKFIGHIVTFIPSQVGIDRDAGMVRRRHWSPAEIEIQAQADIPYKDWFFNEEVEITIRRKGGS